MIPLVNKVFNISDADAQTYNCLPCSMPVGLNDASRHRLKESDAFFSYKLNGERVFVVCDEEQRMVTVNRSWMERPFLPEKPDSTLPAATILDAELMPNGAVFVFDIIQWKGQSQTAAPFKKRIELLRELESKGQLPSPIRLKQWMDTNMLVPEHENLPSDCDGIVFVFADSLLHVGRDKNVIKWKPMPTLDFYVNDKGDILYRFSKKQFAALKFYHSALLNTKELDIVLPMTEARNALIECSVSLVGNRIVLREIGTRTDKKEPNDLETLDETFAEVVKGCSLFREEVAE